MRLDPGPFVAKAQAAAGGAVRVAVDAKWRPTGAVLGRSGMLCLTDDVAVFVEDRVLQPGAVHLVSDPRVLERRSDYLGAEFEVVGTEGAVTFTGIDESAAGEVARAFAQIDLGRPQTRELYAEPDEDDLEIEADEADIEESVELLEPLASLDAPDPLPEKPTDRVPAVPAVVVDFESMPPEPPPRKVVFEPETLAEVAGPPGFTSAALQPAEATEPVEPLATPGPTTWPVVLTGAALGGLMTDSITGFVVGLVVAFFVRKPIAKLLRL